MEDMLNSEILGQRFYEMREKSGFTQGQVAEYLQVDQSYISKCEKGQRKFSIDILEKVADLFGCTVDYFTNKNSKFTPLPTALRADSVEVEDLETIAAVNKIALNLRYMESLLEGDNNENTNWDKFRSH